MSYVYIKTQKVPNINERIAFIVDGYGYSASEGDNQIKVYKVIDGEYVEYEPTPADYDSNNLSIFVRINVDDSKFDYRAHKKTKYNISDSADVITMSYLSKMTNELNKVTTYEKAIVDLAMESAGLPTITAELPKVDSGYVLVEITNNTNGIPMNILGVGYKGDNFTLEDEAYFQDADPSNTPLLKGSCNIVVSRDKVTEIGDYCTVNMIDGMAKDPCLIIAGKVDVIYTGEPGDNTTAYLMYQSTQPYSRDNNYLLHFVKLSEATSTRYEHTILYSGAAGYLMNCTSAYATIVSKKMTDE